MAFAEVLIPFHSLRCLAYAIIQLHRGDHVPDRGIFAIM
jgi:hypothetical protein